MKKRLVGEGPEQLQEVSFSKRQLLLGNLMQKHHRLEALRAPERLREVTFQVFIVKFINNVG